MNFDNKVVIITGASSGIGRGAAEYISSLGASIVIVGRNEKGLNETASKCTKLKTLIVVADVTKQEDRVKIIDETIKKFGKINVLVNNAGQGLLCNAVSTKMEDYDHIMDLNVRSIFNLTQLTIPHLIKTQGNIVNISSVAGLRPTPSVVYGMSKAALDQFTKCLALELASNNVRVNSVNPAAIVTNFIQATGLTDEATKSFYEILAPMHALGRVGNVGETSYAIAFLASEMSTFITGTTLAVDGGFVLMGPRGK